MAQESDSKRLYRVLELFVQNGNIDAHTSKLLRIWRWKADSLPSRSCLPPSLLFYQVDTLEWCRERIGELNKLIEEKRHTISGDYQNYPPQNSAFILFNTQIAAHMAVKSHAHHQPYRMADNYVEAHPLDVVWGNLSMNPYEKKVRTLIGWSITIAIVVFWTVIVGFVGIVSNVKGLGVKVHWLNWLNNIGVVSGIIQGLLPSESFRLETRESRGNL